MCRVAVIKATVDLSQFAVWRAIGVNPTNDEATGSAEVRAIMMYFCIVRTVYRVHA